VACDVVLLGVEFGEDGKFVEDGNFVEDGRLAEDVKFPAKFAVKFVSKESEGEGVADELESLGDPEAKDELYQSNFALERIW
jgi:hypothetical protein